MRNILMLLFFALIGCNNKTPFTEAVRYIHDDDVKKLEKILATDPAVLKTKAHWDQESLLHHACTNVVRINIVSLLINKGAPINARDDQGETPLHYVYNL